MSLPGFADPSLNTLAVVRVCSATLLLAFSTGLLHAQTQLGLPSFDPYNTTPQDPFVPYAGQPGLGYSDLQNCNPGGFEGGFHAAILEPQIAS